MEPVLFFAIGGAAVAAFSYYDARRRSRLWRAAAESCGVTDLVDPSSWLNRSLSGRSGDLEISISSYRHGKHDNGTRVVVRCPGTAPGLSLHAEGVQTSLKKLFGAREVEIGDAAFDSAFFVPSSAAVALAFLDHEVRPLVTTLQEEARIRVINDTVQAEIQHRFNLDLSRKLQTVLSLMLDLGRRLPRDADIPLRLARVARQDPAPLLRLRSLTILTEEFGRHPEAIATARAASSDSAPTVRLRAAQALGPEGHPVLLDIAENGADDECGAKAVTSLGESLSAGRAIDLLERASTSRRLATARACIDRLARLKDDAAVAPLARLVWSDDLGVQAMGALGTIGSPAPEAALLTALTRPSSELRVAAAAALGRVGSAEAVLPLKEAAEADRDLRSVVRQSIAEIQARLAGASPGQLSMSDGDAGQLSLASDAAGQLSLSPETQRGRLSVDGDDDGDAD